MRVKSANNNSTTEQQSHTYKRSTICVVVCVYHECQLFKVDVCIGHGSQVQLALQWRNQEKQVLTHMQTIILSKELLTSMEISYIFLFILQINTRSKVNIINVYLIEPLYATV